MQLKKSSATADTAVQKSPSVRIKKAPARSRRNGGIELWRFVFASFVVFYHFELMLGNMHMLPLGYAPAAKVGFIGVEFFFILAGFFLMRNDAQKRRAGLPGSEADGETLPYPERMSFGDSGREAKSYVLARLRVIYPTLIAVLVLFVLIFFMPGLDGKPRINVLMDLDTELLLLGGTSFGWGDPENPALFLIVTWFITDLLISGYIITLLLKLNRNIVKYLAPLFAVLLYSYFGKSPSFDLHFGHEAYGIFTGGMIRALAGFCLGITAYMVYERLAAAKVNIIGKILLSLLEVYCVFRLFYLVWGREVGVDNFRILIYMPILIILAYSKKSLLSRLFDNPVFRWLGRITLALYLCHSMLLGRYIMTIKPLIMKTSVIKFLVNIRIFGSTRVQVVNVLRSTMFDMVFFLIFCVICAAAITYLTILALWVIKKTSAALASRAKTPELAEQAKV